MIKRICSIKKEKYEMKLKEVIPFVDLTNTFVYVPDKLIKQMPALDKLVNAPGTYYERTYNQHTRKWDYVVMSLSGKARTPFDSEPFKLFKWVSSKKDLFDCEIKLVESTIIDWDQDILKIVLKDKL